MSKYVGVILQTAFSLTVIICYVLLTINGIDGNPLLGILGGQGGAIAISVSTPSNP